MKKKMMILALSAIAFLGVNAQNNTNCNQPCNQQPCNQPCVQADCNKNGKDCLQYRCLRPFEGLNLTDAQKTKLVELSNARAAENKQVSKDRRDRKQQSDSTARAERRAAKAKYLAEVKKVLTPEQYTQFLENFYLNGGKNAKVKDLPGRKHHGMRGDRKFKKERSEYRAVKSDKIKERKEAKIRKDK